MPSNSTKQETNTQGLAFFPAFTGIRAVAVYLLFCEHSRLGEHLLPEKWANLILFTGHSTTSIFFVLSSFVITYRYENAFRQGKLAFSHYYIRRFARIYPLFFILTLLAFWWRNDFEIWHWFLNLTLLKGFFTMEKFTGIGPWTLTVEECFYLSAPFIFASFRKYGIKVVGCILALGFAGVYTAQFFQSKSFLHDIDFMLEYTFLGRIFEFFAGYKLVQFYKQHSQSKMHSISWPASTTVGISLMLACLITITWALPEPFSWLPLISPEILVNNFVLPIGIFLFFYGLLTEKTLVTKLLSSRLMQFLGKNSYAFALLHVGFFYEFLQFHLSANKIVIFLALNVLAFFAHRLIEEPINRLIRNKTNPKVLKGISENPEKRYALSVEK